MENPISEYITEIKANISNGGFEPALEVIDELIRRFPTCEYGYYYKGVCNFALSNYHNAIKEYSKALYVNPGFARAYFNIGVCYFVLRYFDHALINIGKALFVFSKLNNEPCKQRCINALEIVKNKRNSQ